MKKKNFILTVFVFLCLFLNAQHNPLNRPFYYYKGERFYLDVDSSRISVISEGKFSLDNERKQGKLYFFKTPINKNPKMQL
jgi:hypothetical protein